MADEAQGCQGWGTCRCSGDTWQALGPGGVWLGIGTEVSKGLMAGACVGLRGWAGMG
jgi:hypothetical protein